MESIPMMDDPTNEESPIRGLSRTYSADSSPSNLHLRRREQRQEETSPPPPHQRRPPARRRSSSSNLMIASSSNHIRSRNGTWNCCLGSSAGGGKSHLFVLFMGMMLGYLLLPVLLIEVQLTDFLDRSFPDESIGGVMNPAMAVRDVNYFLRTTESRALDGVPSTTKKNKNKQPASNVLSEGAANKVKQSLAASDVEQRLMEDHDVLSKQSMPTATTPYIMKTKVLPDHHRLKILVTGGAGFVGSHLVDKLMMEGHE
eukprot:scaffold20649_cov130-Amphora_coffeaeformis.AAC.1